MCNMWIHSCKYIDVKERRSTYTCMILKYTDPCTAILTSPKRIACITSVTVTTLASFGMYYHFNL